jgi:hypothetical protein
VLLATRVFPYSKDTFSVDYRSDHNFVFLHLINDAVAVDDQLADVLIVEFGNFAPRARKLPWHLCSVYDLVDDNARLGRRIPRQSTRRWPRYREVPVETSLFGQPFAQAHFDLFLRKSAVRLGIFQPTPLFVEHVKVVLNVLDRRVVWELMQQRLDILFGRTHKVPPGQGQHHPAPAKARKLDDLDDQPW